MAHEKLARQIQGIRMICPRCEKQVTPIMMVLNNNDGMTIGFKFNCGDCMTKITEVEL